MRHDLALLLALPALPLAAQNTGIALTNGVDGYLEVLYAAAVVPQSGITVEAWLTYDDTTLPTGWRYPTVVRQNITPQQEAYFLRINADNIGARVLRWKVVTSVGTQLFCSWTFASGQLAAWTHVAATYDGASAALYVNGAPVATAAGSGQPIWDRGGVLRIGKGDDSGGPIEVWNGQLDEVRLWPFARTQAEIQQTMNYQLFSVPGRVSTWNLDNHTLDTSGTLHATSTGAVAFAANPLALTLLPGPSGFPVGASTPGCLGPLQTTFGSLPRAGNAAFAPVCTRAPGGALTFLALAFATGSPLPIGGITYWLDLGSSVLVLTTANGLGTARFPVALPVWLPTGFAVAFQYGFVDPCGPQGLTASDALLVVTQ